jgi:hypothetical protein
VKNIDANGGGNKLAVNFGESHGAILISAEESCTRVVDQTLSSQADDQSTSNGVPIKYFRKYHINQ